MTSSTDLGYRLLRVAGRLNRYANHHTHFEVPPAQLRLLALVGDLEPVRVGRLAALDHSSQPTVTSQLNRTDAAGWTRRSTDPEDARAQVVRLTAEGRRQLDAIRTRRGEAVAPAIAGWPAPSRQQLAAAVTLLEGLLDELTGTPADSLESNDRRES